MVEKNVANSAENPGKMSHRLIDADALWESVSEIKLPRKCEIVAFKLKAAFDAAPTVDAVPVVRCRDCIHYSNDEIGWCDFHSHISEDGNWFEPDEDDFCSCAETEADKLNICGDVDCEGCMLQHHGTIEQCREEAKRRKSDATN